MIRFINRVWASPTANTWASLFTRSISLVLVLPLVLRQFPEDDVAVWFVFSAVLAVQSVLSFGFGPSFSRLIAYARAGASVEAMQDLRNVMPVAEDAKVNWRSIDRLYSCMIRVHAGLIVGSLVLLGTIGTAAVWRPLSNAGLRLDLWLAWAAVVLGAALSFWNLSYVSFLQGMNKVAQIRRWETFVSLGAIASSFSTLLFGGGLFALVISQQIWVLFAGCAYRTLCHRLFPSSFAGLGRFAFEKSVFRIVWGSAWKTGLTNMLTFGLVQVTGLLQAQFGSAESIITYNFTLRIATVLGQVVQAPFNTKLPELARCRAAGDLACQLTLVRRGLRATHWCILLGTAGVPVLVGLVIPLLDIRTLRFDPALWAVFSVNMMIERHGGMLHQIRNVTNQPMEQWGMAGYIVIFVSLAMILQPLGMFSYPLAMLGAQLGFSLWFAARIGYPVLRVSAFSFERNLSIPPFACLLTVQAIILWQWWA